MLARRIIPCLDCDVRGGRVVVLKGTQFGNLRYAGEPAELAEKYQAADELVMLDIGATIQKRETFLHAVRDVASQCSIPLCVGGGVRSMKDFEARIKNGADQCAINTAAIRNPALITECAGEFGAQAVVVAVDAKKTQNGYSCFSSAGKVDEKKGLSVWLEEIGKRGAGEVLLTSIDFDGSKKGFDIGMLKVAAEATSLPLIASGGCSSVDDIAEVFQNTAASGALAASIFHFNETTVEECKAELSRKGIGVRI